MTTNQKLIRSVSNFSDLIKLFHLLFKCCQNFLGLNPKRPYLSFRKKKTKFFGVVFTYSIKQVCEIRKFHVVIVE